MHENHVCMQEEGSDWRLTVVINAWSRATRVCSITSANNMVYDS